METECVSSPAPAGSGYDETTLYIPEDIFSEHARDFVTSLYTQLTLSPSATWPAWRSPSVQSTSSPQRSRCFPSCEHERNCQHQVDVSHITSQHQLVIINYYHHNYCLLVSEHRQLSHNWSQIHYYNHEERLTSNKGYLKSIRQLHIKVCSQHIRQITKHLPITNYIHQVNKWVKKQGAIS